MEPTVVCEPYAIVYESVFPDSDLCISWDELKESEVGTAWSTEDGDRYPNCERSYVVEYTVIYKDENGVLIRKQYDDDEKPEMLYFAFHKKESR